jgi:lipopolysaccharide export system permease protein
MGKTLRGYVGREIGLGFLAGLVIFTFLLLTARIIELVDLVLARGVPLAAVGRLFLLAMPSFLELTMPAALLLGVIVAFGRLANDGELTAIRAAGVSWSSLVGPVILAGTLVSVATLAMSTLARPWANRQVLEAMYDVAKSRATAAVRPGVFNSDFDGIVLYVERTIPESGVLEGILVADERDENARTAVFAERGGLVADERERRIRLHLDAGTAVTRRPGVESYDLTSFRTFEVNLDLTRDIGRTGTRPSDLPLDLLLQSAASAPIAADRVEARIEIHRKLAFATAALLLGLAGLPFAVQVSRSVHARGFALSVALALVYYAVFSAGVVAVRNGTLPPTVGLWLPNAVLASFAALTLARLARDLPPFPRFAHTDRAPRNAP